MVPSLLFGYPFDPFWKLEEEKESLHFCKSHSTLMKRVSIGFRDEDSTVYVISCGWRSVPFVCAVCSGAADSLWRRGLLSQSPQVSWCALRISLPCLLGCVARVIILCLRKRGIFGCSHAMCAEPLCSKRRLGDAVLMELGTRTT